MRLPSAGVPEQWQRVPGASWNCGEGKRLHFPDLYPTTFANALPCSLSLIVCSTLSTKGCFQGSYQVSLVTPQPESLIS